MIGLARLRTEHCEGLPPWFFPIELLNQAFHVHYQDRHSTLVCAGTEMFRNFPANQTDWQYSTISAGVNEDASVMQLLSIPATTSTKPTVLCFALLYRC